MEYEAVGANEYFRAMKVYSTDTKETVCIRTVVIGINLILTQREGW